MSGKGGFQLSRQILITGTPRSGTTLLAQMVIAHPEVEGTYDAVNFMRFCYNKYGEDGDIELLPLLNDLYERIYLRWGLEFDVDKVKDRLHDKCTYAAVYDAVMWELFLEDSPAMNWCEKTTNVWYESLGFMKMFHTGKVLHITRNPVDVLASWKKFTHAPGNDYLDILFNCLASERHAKLFDHHLRNYMHVDYDDLVNHPKETAQAIANFLEIPYHPNMIDPDKYVDKQGNLWIGNSMFSEKIKGIMPNNQKSRDKYLEQWEKDLVRMIFGSGIVSAQSKHKILEEIMKSKLATNGLLKYLMLDMGVQRFPLDPLDPENWESEEEQLMKWQDD